MSEPMDAETVNFDPRSLDVKVWFGNNSSPLVRAPQVAFPSVNRRLKGDRMPAPVPASTSSGSDAAPLQPLAPSPQGKVAKVYQDVDPEKNSAQVLADLASLKAAS